MALEDFTDLLTFLEPFDEAVQERLFWLREFIWSRYPHANELIYDNYNAVAVGWSLNDRLGATFCSLAAFRTNQSIHFGFLKGASLSDPDKLLIGQGSQYRYVRVDDLAFFPIPSMEALLRQSYENTMTELKGKSGNLQGNTIVKSISPVRREK